MNVFAYCTESAREAVRAATGTEPLTSPPMASSDFEPTMVEGQDVLYFRLHGKPASVAWYGDGDIVALLPYQLWPADLGGAVAIVANCYGAAKPEWIDALYEAGASAVIAGGGLNMAAARKVVGVDLLAQWVIRLMRWGADVRHALRIARMRLWLTGWRASDRDAAQFSLLGGDDETAKT